MLGQGLILISYLILSLFPIHQHLADIIDYWVIYVIHLGSFAPVVSLAISDYFSFDVTTINQMSSLFSVTLSRLFKQAESFVCDGETPISSSAVNFRYHGIMCWYAVI